jgi:hypothetical protein
LHVEGSFLNESIPLYAGWNLVSYKSIETKEVLEAITSIIDKLNSIWTYDENAPDNWLQYFPGGHPYFNDLRYIEPGRAYWLDMKENGQW